MFSHIMIGTNDLEKAKAFYDALLGTLDVRPAKVDRHRIFYFTKTGTFSVSKPINGEPATFANGGTIGFKCDSPEQVLAFHAKAVANDRTTVLYIETNLYGPNPPGSAWWDVPVSQVSELASTQKAYGEYVAEKAAQRHYL